MTGVARFVLVAVLATNAAGAQDSIPIRRLTPAVAPDSGVLKFVFGAMHLSSGGVLVNDVSQLKLIVFDSTLRKSSAVTDASGRPQPYGSVAGFLFPYIADSSVFYDQQSRAFLVIDGAGRMGRTMAPPKPEDMFQIIARATASHGFDSQGRFIYRVMRPSPRPDPNAPRPEPGTTTVVIRRDSAAIVRADPNTRSVDTLGFIAQAPLKTFQTTTETGVSSYIAINPLTAADEWVLLPDGTVAFVRTQDYHIDWVYPDGKTASTPKMPFPWRRVTEEEKVRMIDSAHKAYDERMANMPPPPPRPPGLPPLPPRRPFTGVEPKDMPDYYPPIRSGTVRADPEGNVWILPTTSLLVTKGLVFDVVNRKGEVFERVEIPTGRNIVAFGPGGIVYMTWTKTPGDVRLERARVIR